MAIKRNQGLRLPAAFYGPNKAVDEQLVRDLLATVPEAGAFIKLLAKKVGFARNDGVGDRAKFVAEKLPDPMFRKAWNALTSTKAARNRDWLPFYQLLNDWLRREFPFLDLPRLHAEPGIKTFVVPDKSYYLDPSSAPQSRAYVSRNNGDPRAAALLIWAYAEAAAWKGVEKGRLTSQLVEQFLRKFTEAGFTFGVEVCALVRPPIESTATEEGGGSVIVSGYPQGDDAANRAAVEVSDVAKHQPSDPLSVDRAGAVSDSGGQQNSFDGGSAAHPVQQWDEDARFIRRKAAAVEACWAKYIDDIDRLVFQVNKLKGSPAEAHVVRGYRAATEATDAIWQQLKNLCEELDEAYRGAIRGIVDTAFGGAGTREAAITEDGEMVSCWVESTDSRLSDLEQLKHSAAELLTTRRQLRRHKVIVAYPSSKDTVEGLMRSIREIADNSKGRFTNKVNIFFNVKCAKRGVAP